VIESGDQSSGFLIVILNLNLNLSGNDGIKIKIKNQKLTVTSERTPPGASPS